MSRGLPVFSVNVDEVDINLHRVSADSYKPFFEMTMVVVLSAIGACRVWIK